MKSCTHRPDAAFRRKTVGVLAALLMILFQAAVPMHAQEAGTALSKQTDAGAPRADAASVSDSADETRPELGKKGDRIFGVLPNYSTVEGAKEIQPITARQTFQMAVLNSFDPYVFPFIGVVAGFGQNGGGRYGTRYATALADNSIGNFMTSAVFPSALHQDPRYFELGKGGFLHRAGYSLTRSFVTRSRSGQTQFNYSEIGGNALAAGISNIYYPRSDRTVADTLTRWAMQVLWDTLSNELKEFWPDIRQKIRKR